MRTLFLGDAHLRPPAGPIHDRLVAFLDAVDADRLIVMGDLFDFLVGLGRKPASYAAAVLDALGRLARRGVVVTYLEGNHDFHLRPVLDPRVEVWAGPVDLPLGELRVHLAHGDEIQRRDLGYALLRPAVRSRPAIFAGRALGTTLVHRLGHGSARTSRDLRAGRSRDWRAEKLRYARRMAGRGTDLVVLGHSHQLFTERVATTRVLQVGRFDVRDQHALLDGRRLELREGVRVVGEVLL